MTGAAGQIGYSLVFRIARGDLLGPDQPVVLSMLEITPALGALNGVVMELMDCAFPLLHGIETSDDAAKAFEGVNYALLVGSRPRTKGMERKELLEANGAIFTAQGKALARERGRRRARARGRQPRQHELPHRDEQRGLDPARAVHGDDAPRPQPGQGPARGEDRRAGRVGHEHDDLGQPLRHPVPRPLPRQGRRQDRERSRRPGLDRERLHPDRAAARRRGIEARGASSAASAANAALDHMRDWALGTAEGDWASMAVCSDGSYGVPEGLISGFPCTTEDGVWKIVQGLDIDDFSRGRIDASVGELGEERDAVTELGLI